MDFAFQLENVVREYPDFKLGPLSLSLEKGKVLGLIGPNGSGKTTTMQCMIGLLKHSEGTIKIFGEENDPNRISWKEKIGYVGDKHVFYENWSCEKNLKFVSQFYKDWDDKKAQDLVEKFQLPLKKKAASLSKGNRVKLSLIQALSHNPKLLLLDEPTEGLDPVVRSEFMDSLFELIEDEERAIFYSTHIISEIDRICDKVAFLKEGDLLMKTEKETLTEQWRTITFSSEQANLEIPGIVEKQQAGSEYKVITSSSIETMQRLRELGIVNVRESRMTMEDIAVRVLKGGKNVETL